MLEPKKRKSVTASMFSPSICHEKMGPDVMILGVFFIYILMVLKSLVIIAKLKLNLKFRVSICYHL